MADEQQQFEALVSQLLTPVNEIRNEAEVPQSTHLLFSICLMQYWIVVSIKALLKDAMVRLINIFVPKSKKVWRQHHLKVLIINQALNHWYSLES